MKRGWVRISPPFVDSPKWGCSQYIPVYIVYSKVNSLVDWDLNWRLNTKHWVRVYSNIWNMHPMTLGDRQLTLQDKLPLTDYENDFHGLRLISEG